MTEVQTSEQQQALMETGTIALENGEIRQVELCRGMVVHSQEGNPVGHIAAVVMSDAREEVTHILVVHQTQQLHYRLLPVTLITSVTDSDIQLDMVQQALRLMPEWHATE